MDNRVPQKNPQGNFASLPFSSTSDNIVCTMGKSVTLRKTTDIQTDRDQHIFVAQRSQSKTKDPTKNFCWKDVLFAMMSGAMKLDFDWRVPWIFVQQMPGTTGIAYVPSWL
ncbi:hypothetical protein E2C01_075924 [Portunus trituberculatus]|uniref:Uncharacterized protein n=1 Tax=Portunus trituberculatus TaxID=210409 RepID=A0A5B7IID0_PORTR|nr:hypothetical protein [Portunus trituberculatus]